jgi:hypothetical protein
VGRQQHRFHGAEARFYELEDFVYERYGSNISYIADVAGGQGMLSRVLMKKYNYESEVVDPRGNPLKGVSNRAVEFTSDLASYYDLVIGLHPDQATRPVAESALVRPVILSPCCNFWSSEKLGQYELLEAIEQYYCDQGVRYERLTLNFKGPKNIALVSEPPL